MANIWQNYEDNWVRQPLGSHYAVLPTQQGLPIQNLQEFPHNADQTTIANYERGDTTPLWVLLSGTKSRARINGKILSGGIHRLSDRDEVSFDGNSLLYFSTEEVATVEPFPVSDHPVFCARCRQSIEHGTSAVKCPSCGHWCEQSESKPCWKYGPTCPLCDQPTAFDTGLRWTPEAL